MPQSPVRVIGILLLALPTVAQFKTPSPGASIEQAAHASATNAKEVPAPKEPIEPSWKFEVLANTKGYNLGPYINTVFPVIRDEWYAAIHQLVKNPNYRRGTVRVECAIARSGEIQNVKITEASGEDDLDKAVTQAFEKATPLPELPKDLSAKQLEMHFNFFYKGKNPPRWWQR
jgi:TonB family protein